MRIAKPAVELAIAVARTQPELLALADDYARLQLVTRNQSPFALHDWHIAWSNHFLHSDPQIEAQLLVHVLRTVAGNCVGIVPLIRTRRGYEMQVSAAVQSSLRRMWPLDWVSWRAASAPHCCLQRATA